MQIFSPYLCISYNIYGEVRRKRVSSEVYLPLEVRNLKIQHEHNN